MILRRCVWTLLVWLSPALLAVAIADEPMTSPSRLKVLFLGDRGHHVPADRAAQLIPVMAGRGIDIAYTEDVDQAFDPQTLSKFDVLLVYANIDTISPEHARALLDFVKKGGGFAPIHCASYCFRNDPAIVDLIGAQFSRHGTGEFDARVVEPNHPIMKGLTPFHTWDETYVHTKHNSKDRTVLQVRDEGDKSEPWTWVRTYGKGRVFYTAYGHDWRTWSEPGFQDLIERGLRWASGKGGVFDSRPRVREGLKAFTYSPAKIPNYLPSKSWGTQGEPIKTMQDPISPEESMRHMVVPPGFKVEPFAAEPDIHKPITMAWDERGRLWISESVDYPNEKRPEGQGRDRIKICEDTDGDGKADKFSIFADRLSIPTSIAFARGGAIVHCAPDTLFLKDTDGDGKADVRETLLHGWGVHDTHAGPSNLRLGFDHWLYGIVGYSAFHGEVGGERQSFRQGFYRFKPDGSKLEFLRNTSNNSWGVGFSEDGLLFGSTANGCPSVYLPIPNRYYERVRGLTSKVLPNIDDSYRYYPITDKIRQVDWHGGFTAAAGHALYTARTYPKHYWNSVAFVAEPTGHLVATLTLQRKGSDVASHYGWNLLAGDDEWIAPILAEVGPDGNVWIIDWYNYIVQHNPTPKGFETGKGNAYVTPLRDKTRGRIYRVVYENGKPSPGFKLAANDPETLLKALKSENLFWRSHAQRLLVERGRTDVAADLIKLVKDHSVDAIGLNAPAIHALWTLSGLGLLEGERLDRDALAAANEALRHPSAGVRRNAVQVLPANAKTADAILAAKLTRDPDAFVRLAAFLTLSEAPPSAETAKAIIEAIAAGDTAGDPHLADAAVIAAAANDQEFLKELATRKFAGEDAKALLPVARKVAEHEARGGPTKTIGDLVVALADADPRLAETVLEGLIAGWPRNRPAILNEKAEKALARLAERLPLNAVGRLASLARLWGSKALDRRAGLIAESFWKTVRDENQIENARVEAARQLVELRRGDSKTATDLLDLITPRTSPALAAGLIEAVSKSEADEVGRALAKALPGLTPAARAAAMRAALGRDAWTIALLDAIEAGRIRASELALDQQQSLAARPDRTIAERAQKLLAQGGGLPDADRQKVIDALAPLVMKGGDPGRGKAIFVQECSKCHTHSGTGGKVGPDLTGMAVHPREELIVHILDPSRSVEGNFVQYTLATADGRSLSGLLASESKTAVELIDAEGKSHSVPRDEIEELAASKKSLMPEGFEKRIPAEGLADLLAFLTQRGRYLPLDLRKAATVVSTRGMFFGSDNRTERIALKDWSPKTIEGIPFQFVDPNGDRLNNAVLLHSPQGTVPPKMPKSASIDCRAAAKAIYLLGGVGGWAFPYGEKGSISMIVRLHYADGEIENHPLRNGVQIADYIRRVDVPESKFAVDLDGRQLRLVTVIPQRAEKIDRIELLKGPDRTAPFVMAVTIEPRD